MRPGNGRRHSSLKLKILIGAVLCNFVALICYEIPMFAGEIQRSAVVFHSRSTRTTERLAANLSLPFWSLDRTAILDQIRSELQDPGLAAVKLNVQLRSKLLPESEFFNSNSPTAPDSFLYGLFDLPRQIEIVRPIVHQDEAMGTIACTFHFTELIDRANELSERILGEMIIFTLLVAILLLLVLQRLLDRPLHAILLALGSISSGDYSARIDVHQHDEMGQLAKGINDTARDLQEAHDRLQGHASRLQDLVSERSDRLVESEKRAAISLLVRGMAHELNTPIGISLTVATCLGDSLAELERNFRSQQLSASGMERYISEGKQSFDALIKSINRSATLIERFKQVSVDQYSDVPARLDIHAHVNMLFGTLNGLLEQQGIRTIVLESIESQATTYPAVLSQVLVQLALNSSHHAWVPDDTGRTIAIQLEPCDTGIRIVYGDNGRSIPPAVREDAWQAFRSLHRIEGGTGLGLYIVRSLVEQKLRGTIHMQEHFSLLDPLPDRPGLGFELLLPFDLPASP